MTFGLTLRGYANGIEFLRGSKAQPQVVRLQDVRMVAVLSTPKEG